MDDLSILEDFKELNLLTYLSWEKDREYASLKKPHDVYECNGDSKGGGGVMKTHSVQNKQHVYNLVYV